MSFVSEFFEEFTKCRTELYQQNFWEHKQDNRSGSDSFGPIPLDEQTSWLASYENWGECLNDVYSIVYKPVVMIYAALRFICQGLGFAFQFLGNAAASFFNSLPPLISSQDSEEDYVPTAEPKEIGQFAVFAVANLCAAVISGAFYLPYDTLCSLISVILRPIVTGVEAVASALTDNSPSTSLN